MQIRINERLRSHFPALKPEEYNQLEANILAHGCQSPLIVWGGVLLDGHHRYDICNRHGVPFRVETIELPDFDAAIAWIEENHLGRRNLTADQFAYYIGRKYERLKKAQGGTGANQYIDKEQSDQNDHSARSEKTSNVIAGQHGISAPTVRRDAAYARDVDDIANTFGDDARTQLLSGEDKLTRKAIAEMAAKATEAKQSGIGFDDLKRTVAEAETLDRAKQIRIRRSEEQRAKNEALSRANPPPVVEGKYGTIIIDPPWPMDMIERDCRPNQVGLVYPTMTEEELAAFPVADMAADDCHLFLWATQRFLLMAFSLVRAWGFQHSFLISTLAILR
jgi:hypothetical protein